MMSWRRRFWRAAHTGRPLAEDRWLAKVEAKLGRRLRARAVGRPRKVEKAGGSLRKRAKAAGRRGRKASPN
jgi:hypothetical protein